MAEEQRDNDTRYDRNLRTAADEGAILVRKVLRREIDLDDPATALMVSLAKTAMSAYAKHEQTMTNREATRAHMAGMLASEDNGQVSEYLRITMPDHGVVRRLDAYRASKAPKIEAVNE